MHWLQGQEKTNVKYGGRTLDLLGVAKDLCGALPLGLADEKTAALV